MDDLNKYSKIELQKIGNDIKLKHDTLKQEIINITYEIEKLENILNEKVKLLQGFEKNYVDIVEKLIE